MHEPPPLPQPNNQFTIYKVGKMTGDTSYSIMIPAAQSFEFGHIVIGIMIYFLTIIIRNLVFQSESCFFTPVLFRFVTPENLDARAQMCSVRVCVCVCVCGPVCFFEEESRYCNGVLLLFFSYVFFISKNNKGKRTASPGTPKRLEMIFSLVFDSIGVGLN